MYALFLFSKFSWIFTCNTVWNKVLYTFFPERYKEGNDRQVAKFTVPLIPNSFKGCLTSSLLLTLTIKPKAFISVHVVAILSAL